MGRQSQVRPQRPSMLSKVGTGLMSEMKALASETKGSRDKYQGVWLGASDKYRQTSHDIYQLPLSQSVSCSCLDAPNTSNFCWLSPFSSVHNPYTLYSIQIKTPAPHHRHHHHHHHHPKMRSTTK